MSCANVEPKEQRDINEIFDDIVLTEERLASKSYQDGYSVGCLEGEREGYQLGYAKGLALGQELANIYGLVVAEQQNEHPTRTVHTLKQLRDAIDEFPRENDPSEDIIGKLENIRTLYKKLCVMLSLTTANEQEHKDLSY